MNHRRLAILLTLAVLASDQSVSAQPVDFNIAGQMPANPDATVGIDGSRSATMRYDRDTDAELLFENALRHLQEGNHAEAVAVLQQALDVDVRGRILIGDTYRHPWFYALSLLRSLPADSQMFIERLAGARGELLLERAWRTNDLQAVEKIAVQFRYTRAGRDALRRLAACAMDEGDYLRAADCYARLFEEEPDPFAAASADPGSLVCWLICEHRLANQQKLREIWQRYRSVASSQMISANGEPVSVESWLLQQVYLPAGDASVDDGERELASLIPVEQSLWTYSVSDENDPRRSWLATLEQLGEFGLTGVHRSPAVVVGNRVLFATVEGLICLNIETGERLWAHELYSSRSSMEMYGGEDFTLARQSLGGGLYGQITCDGETVYFVAEDDAIHSANSGTIRRRNRLVACDLETGDIVWEAADVRIADDRRSRVVSQYFLSPPVTEGHTLYVLGQESFQDPDAAIQLLVMDARTGALESAIELGATPRTLLEDPHRQEFAGCIMLQGELAICATGWGSVAAVDPIAEAVRWAHTFPRLNMHAAQSYSYDFYGAVPGMIGWEWWRGWRGVTLEAAGDRTIFASPETNRLIAYDYRTGQIVWELPRRFGRFVADILPDRVLVAGTTGIEAFDLATGSVLWSVETPPIVGTGFTAGNIYVASLGGGHCLAIDVEDGRVLFQSRLDPQVLAAAVVGGLVVDEPASLIQHDDALLRVTPSSISRLQSLSIFSERFAIGDDPTAQESLRYAQLLEDLGNIAEADRLLASLVAADSEATEQARAGRIALLLRQLTRGTELTSEQDEFLRGSGSRNVYLSLRVHQRLAAGTRLASVEAQAILDDVLALMADNPEGKVFHAPQGRKIRLDRFLQGAILDLLNQADDADRPALEQQLASRLEEAFASAENARELWLWVMRTDRLPWGQAQAVQPTSLVEVGESEKLVREMLLWELTTSSNPAIAAQAVLRLAELPSSSADGIPELLFDRMTPHLDVILADGRAVKDVIQAAGADTIWPLALSANVDPLWPEVTPEVRDSNRRTADRGLRSVTIEPAYPAPLDGINVEVEPQTGIPGSVRFSGRADSFWSVALPSENIAPLAQPFGSSYFYYTAPELTQSWNVGSIVYLQVGASLFAFTPFDSTDDRGDPVADFAWPRQREIRSTGQGGIPNTQTTRAQRNGVRDVTTEYTDSFGYRVDTFGPFRANFFCTPQTGSLMIRSSGTGRELWRLPLVAGSRWLANDDVVVVYEEQSWEFTVHRAVDGKPLATHQLPARPIDLLDTSGCMLLLELPADGTDPAALSRLVAWDASEGAIAWSRPLNEDTLPFLIDQQLVGLVDRASEQMELIDFHTGETLCTHVPDQADHIQDIHCIVNAEQVIVVVSRVPEGQAVLQGTRIISLEGTLHAFDREQMQWMWTRHMKDIDINLDQPRHLPVLVLHEVPYDPVDPFGEPTEIDTKLRFAVIDRRTGEVLVDETLERNVIKPFTLTTEVDGRIVRLRTNADQSFEIDYGAAE